MSTDKIESFASALKDKGIKFSGKIAENEKLSTITISASDKNVVNAIARNTGIKLNAPKRSSVLGDINEIKSDQVKMQNSAPEQGQKKARSNAAEIS